MKSVWAARVRWKILGALGNEVASLLFDEGKRPRKAVSSEFNTPLGQALKLTLRKVTRSNNQVGVEIRESARAGSCGS